MHSCNNTTSIFNYNTNPAGIPQMSLFSENDMINSISILQHTPSSPSLFNFPPNSPHMMYMEYEDVYLQFPEFFDQSRINPSYDDHHNHEINAMATETKELSAAADNEQVVNIVRKRLSCTNNKSSKKDRHSKINTARGPRDRRMRLSLDVARKFFDLQDLLGYDKASRTVEWLLNSSKLAIKELLNNSAGNTSTTALSSTNCDDYCEVISISSSTITTTTTTTTTNNNSNLGKLLEENPGPAASKVKSTKKMSKVTPRRAATTVGRESRTKARERAKERTSQKRRLSRMSETMSITSTSTNTTHQQPNLYSHHSGTTTANHVHMQAHEDLRSGEARMLVYGGSWNPSTSHFSAGISDQQHDQELPEFQFCGKAWEDYNNISSSG